ncbi:MAG: aminotransferase class III-fold pyridoxal phosphate-dependent enzyme [Woeseia sp.]
MTRTSRDTDTADLIERRSRLMGPAYRLFYENPLHVVKGRGVWLYDRDGDEYLDMYNNVPHVGHCHPHVVEALIEQITALNTHTRYLHENVLDYAERLTGKFPEELGVAMFSCTGSEANELALRIARAYTGGTGIIVTEFAYHGNTHATWQISTESIPKRQIPDFVIQVPAPDTYRGTHRGEDAAERYADSIRAAISGLHDRGVKPAAFIADTIMSSSGVVSPPPGYLKKAAEFIRAAGGLFIADEVQPGFGRTGKHFWGFEADGFIPDIVTMGKPMGNGHPLAATVTRADIVERFADGADYFNTFGGNPVSCAAGLAVLDVLEKEKLQQNALDVGRHLIDGLRSLAGRHECVGDIRGTGLFLAVDLVLDRATRGPAADLASRVVNGLRERRVLTGSTGPHGNILKLRPPMVFSKENADYFLGIVDEVLAET